MSATHDIFVPRGALIGAGILVAGVLALTAGLRIADVQPAATPDYERARAQVAPVSQRDLTFRDRADGAVVIADGTETVRILAPGEQDGFIRGVLRAFSRDRKMRGIGPAEPYRLTLWRDGSISLVDRATGRSFDLGGFGATNRAAFVALLEPRG